MFFSWGFLCQKEFPIYIWMNRLFSSTSWKQSFSIFGISSEQANSLQTDIEKAAGGDELLAVGWDWHVNYPSPACTGHVTAQTLYQEKPALWDTYGYNKWQHSWQLLILTGNTACCLPHVSHTTQHNSIQNRNLCLPVFRGKQRSAFLSQMHMFSQS